MYDIAALDVAIAATALQFKFNKTSPKAAGLLLPYLAWCAYATALNYNILQKNGPQGTEEEWARTKELDKKDTTNLKNKVVNAV